MSGLRAWYKADAIIPDLDLEGSLTVKQWRDESGNPQATLRQTGTTELQPFYVPTAINNRPALRFDGNDILQTSVAYDLQESSEDVTIIVVAKPATTQVDSAQLVDFGCSNCNGGWQFGQYEDMSNTYRFSFLGESGWDGDGARMQAREDHVQILSAIKESKVLTLFQNYAQAARLGVSSTMMSDSNSLLAIGGPVGTGVNRWKGDLAEVIIYNRTLTDAETQQVTAYLDTKYGIIPNLPIPKKGLRAWFRADIGVTNSTSGVNTWSDYISGFKAIQESANECPALVDDGRGGSTIRFDGTDDILQTSPMDLLGDSDDLSVFVVAHPTTSQPAYACIVDHQLNPERNPNHGFAIEQDSVVGNRFCLNWLDSSGGQPAAGAKVTVATDEMHIFTAVKSGTDQVVSVNSGPEPLTASVSKLPEHMLSATNPLGIGGSTLDPAARFAGEVSAIIIYNRALSEDDQKSVQDYLAETYSLHGTKFQFYLEASTTTSAGVYTSDDKLIRTLWRKETLGPGMITRTWDGKLDGGIESAPPGTYQIKLISHDVQYVWDGVIGNTSTSIVGPSHHAGQTFIHSLAVDADHHAAFYALGEAEGFAPVRRFDTTSPQTAINVREPDTKIGVDHVATDGVLVYYANKGAPLVPGAHPSFVAASTVSTTPTPAPFSNGTCLGVCPPGGNGQPYYPGCIDVIPLPTPAPGGTPFTHGATGLAVQKNGNILAVSHGTLNEIRLYDKTYGEEPTVGGPMGVIAINNPGELAMTPGGDLWVLSGTTAQRYSNLNDSPKLVTTISGLTAPAGITVRQIPSIGVGNGDIDVEGGEEQVEIIIADGGAAQVLKSFNMDGSPRWLFPTVAGGYATRGPDVTYDKFLFQVGARRLPNPVIRAAISAEDGTIWVGEGATSRLLRLNVTDDQGHMSFLDQIMFLVYNENGDADPNHPTRVIGDGWLEFEVDYTKRLQESGAWTLKKNWAAGLPQNYFAEFGGNDEGIREITTLDGRVYGTITAYPAPGGSKVKTLVQLPLTAAENPPVGNLRICGVLPNLFTASAYGLDLSQPPTFERDGSLRYVKIAPGGTSPVVTWYQKDLIGFANNNPQWGAERELASAPYRNEDPVVFNEKGFRQNRNPITLSGVIVTFDDTFMYTGDNTKTNFPDPSQHWICPSKWKHLGGVGLGRSDWSWKSSPTVLTDVPFDGLGSFDVGDHINYAASLAMVQGRNVIYSFHGENWNTSEASQWMHFYDNGLFIGQFGTSGEVRNRWAEAIPGFTGNSLFPSMVNVDGNNQAAVNGETYLWTDDKSLHSGVARWHILGANSVREFYGSVALGGSTTLTIPTPEAPLGLVATPGDGQVTLTWLPIRDWSELPPLQLNYTYHVKYSAFSGGPYTEAGSTSGTTFTVSRPNGTQYYFVVSAGNSPVNSKQVAAFPFSGTIGKAGHMIGGYPYPLQVSSGAPAAGRNSLTGLPALLGDLTRTDIGHLGYVIYNWTDGGTINSQTPVPYTTVSNLPGPVSVNIAQGSAWINARDHVLNQFAIDGALGRDTALDLHTNTTGSIDISVSDGATHYVTAFCPLAGGGPRNFTIKITPASGSPPFPPSYTIDEAQNFANNHTFQFSFVGNVKLTIENLSADQSACLQALFFD